MAVVVQLDKIGQSALAKFGRTSMLQQYKQHHDAVAVASLGRSHSLYKIYRYTVDLIDM